MATGGIDTFDFSNYTTNLSIDLIPGGRVNLGTQLANFGDGHTAKGNIYISYYQKPHRNALLEVEQVE